MANDGLDWDPLPGKKNIILFHMFDVHKQEVCAALPLKGMNGAGHESESESDSYLERRIPDLIRSQCKVSIMKAIIPCYEGHNSRC